MHVDDLGGSRATPLQIAVFNRDILAVEGLLEAGADANDRGDPQGKEWREEQPILSAYNRIHGVAPLDVLMMKNSHLSNGHDRETSEQIRDFLVSSGAMGTGTVELEHDTAFSDEEMEDA
ncbi:hypothetical protein B0H67DRAFT_648962 [Lasiosphaeris hirsuta]|uniref:Ankyrin repeat protein n=1 Tax=Lasiosphaeris hirsuta TaxID=260670 RepID=A0AA39ZVL1_9PEZI|nr:hypothetical protein B0H67DRAFT_648962 [Lasiosphaeris hirsuta]